MTYALAAVNKFRNFIIDIHYIQIDLLFII